MVNSSKNPLVIVKHGAEYRVDTLAYNYEIRKGMASLAGTRDAGEEIGGRDGSPYISGKIRDAGRMVLNMWATNNDEDGRMIGPGDGYETWRKNLDFLMWLFDTSIEQIEVREYVKPLPRANVATPTRRNYLPNPSMRLLEADGTPQYWRFTGVATATRPNEGGSRDNKEYLKVTITGQTNPAYVFAYSSPRIATQPGDVWRIAYDARIGADSSSALTNVGIYPYVEVYDADNNKLATGGENAYPHLLSKEWKTYTNDAVTVPEGGSTIVVRYYTASGDLNGAVVDLDNAILEKSSTVGPYFDGDTAPEGFTSSWAGNPNASESVLTHPYVRSFCEVTANITPDVMDIGWTGPFTVELVVNDTFKESSGVYTYQSPTGSAAVGTHTIEDLASSTAPNKDMVLIVTGPVDRPTFTDPVSKHTLKLQQKIPAGQEWRVNCRTFESHIGNAQTFEAPVGSSATANTVSNGKYSPRLFALSARGPLAPTITFSGGETTSATKFRIQARRKFH